MSTVADTKALSPNKLPTHLDLPDEDGAIVTNFQEFPQNLLLTDAITPILEQLHPDHQYCIGQDCGIYFLPTDPPMLGCRSPDWFYVPNVPPQLPDSPFRRSYVMWQELEAPFLLIEYVSGDGSEERDRTPRTGKFWIYERAVRATYYVIYDPSNGDLEVYEMVRGRYQQLQPDARGLYLIPSLSVCLGVWNGTFANATKDWLRFYAPNGELLVSGWERVQQVEQEKTQLKQEKDRIEQEKDRIEQEKDRIEQEKDRLAAKLRELGIDPEQLS